MRFAVLALLFLIWIIGLVELEHDWSSSMTHTRTDTSAASAAQMFVAYRDATLTYLEDNPDVPATSGTIPTASLPLPTELIAAQLPASITNYVVVSGSTRTVYVWENAVPGIVQAWNQEFPGDESFGTVTGLTPLEWVSAAGGVMSAIPATVPALAGDTISVFQIGE
jgi:hypothetical protein